MTAKIAYTIDEILEIHPGGRTRLYDAIREGHLVARKQGRQTIILYEDYAAYLHALPRLEPKAEVEEAA